MRFKLLIVLFLITSIVSAQDTSLLKKKVLELNSALVSKDAAILKILLHPKLKFGHSNGWVQNFNDVFVDMQSGKLQYSKIDVTITNITCTSKWAIVESKGLFEGNVNGTDFNLKLHVMQTWIWIKNKWLMISRQSTKL
jgi:hypothetical protein